MWTTQWHFTYVYIYKSTTQIKMENIPITLKSSLLPFQSITTMTTTLTSVTINCVSHSSNSY